MSTLKEARDCLRTEPVYLVEIEPLGAGAPVLYLSEREIVVDGTRYEGYLQSIEGVRIGLRRISSGMFPSPLKLGFLNEPWRGYASLLDAGEDYPLDGAALTLSETYISPEGETTSPAIVAEGVLSGIIQTDRLVFYAGVRGRAFSADIA